MNLKRDNQNLFNSGKWVCQKDINTMNYQLLINVRTNDAIENFRLPRSIIPSHYDVLIVPILETNTTEGKVAITTTVDNGTQSATFHMKNLYIDIKTIDQYQHEAITVLCTIFCIHKKELNRIDLWS